MSNEAVLKKLKAERAANTEAIRQLNNRIKIITNRERDTERRERTHRLIEKGAIIESIFPHSAMMYSVAATACANGMNVEQYLTELFRRESGTVVLPW